MKKIFIINIILMIVMLLFDALYIIFDGILLKALASGVFVLVGLINLIYSIKLKIKHKFSFILFFGLIFAMMGDIILEIQFIFGALLFAVGHIFFFVSYCTLMDIKVRDFCYGLAIFIPSMLVIIFVPIFSYPNLLMEIICVVYALIISLMVGKSISNYVQQKSLLNLIIVIGSVLFFLSDLMLLLNVFGDINVAGIICLVLYYPAEFLLAYSIYVFVGKEINIKTQNIKIKT